MDKNDKIRLFEDKRIRTAWDEEKEEWYFSIVDVVAMLTDQPDARHASTYWAVLKNRLKEEGANELLTNCKQLKMTATDGKRRATDVADTGKPVITAQNAAQLNQVVADMIEGVTVEQDKDAETDKKD